MYYIEFQKVISKLLNFRPHPPYHPHSCFSGCILHRLGGGFWGGFNDKGRGDLTDDGKFSGGYFGCGGLCFKLTRKG